MKIAEALNRIRSESENRGINISEQEKVMILSEVTGRNYSSILSSKDMDLTAGQHKRLLNFLQELFVNQKPLEKITRRSYFYGLDLYVDCNVLSPRHDTEILVERVLEYIRSNRISAPRILDLGTGSACISIAIAKNCNVGGIVASDVSCAALKVAGKNIKKYMMENIIDIRKSDLFENIKEEFDIIVTNPPYISKDEMTALDRKVRCYDPAQALYGGVDGLDFFRALFMEAHDHIKKGGAVFCEIGAGQADIVRQMMEGRYRDICIYQDLGGNDRVIYGRLI